MIPSKNTFPQIENFVCCLGQLDKMGILLFCILLPTVISQHLKEEKVDGSDMDSLYMPFEIRSQSNIGFRRFPTPKETSYQEPTHANYTRKENGTDRPSIKDEENGKDNLLANFIFHKVDLESSYDPFTKRPYHRTILAMKALPGEPTANQRRNFNEAADTYLPHYYFILNNQSGGRWREEPVPKKKHGAFRTNFHKKYENVEPRPPNENFRPNNATNKHDFRSKFSPSNRLHNQSQDAGIKQNIRRQEDDVSNPVFSSSLLGRPEGENRIYMRKNSNSDAAWVSSYLERPSKINTFQKQLRFLHRWLSRLDRRELKKIRHKQKKKRIFFSTPEKDGS